MVHFERLEPRLLLQGTGLNDDGNATADSDFQPEDGVVLDGDWDGDGDMDAGAFEQTRRRRGEFRLDMNGDDTLQEDERFVVRGARLVPLAADVDDDGTTDIGTYKKGKVRFDTDGDHRLTRQDMKVRVAGRRYTEASVVDLNSDGHLDLAVRKPDQAWKVHLWDDVDYPAFARALGRAGVKLFGAFWCGRCAQQDALFKDGVKKLPKIECSTPDGQSQRPICQANDIQGYPTWEYADGTRAAGVQSLADLSNGSGVPIPTTDRPFRKYVDFETPDPLAAP
jgi:hypothetical protein